jgi:succinate dehydrogenase / fumarate reductase iron-sulfur subunit
MNINLKVWRQKSDEEKGTLKTYRLENIDPNISFLEMLDILNIKLVKEKKDPVAFDHDCREGICGSCGFMINGRPHGPQKATTVCQLHMSHLGRNHFPLLKTFR